MQRHFRRFSRVTVPQFGGDLKAVLGGGELGTPVLRHLAYNAGVCALTTVSPTFSGHTVSKRTGAEALRLPLR